MKKEERSFIYGCFYLWILCVVIKETYSIHFQKSKYSDGYAGSRCLPNETIFEIHDLSGTVQCSKVCFMSIECRSVFYHPDDHKCIGCSVSLGSCDVNLMAYLGSLAFDFDDTIYTDCKDIMLFMPSPRSGIYDITLQKSQTKLKVYCDMETDGGGWTVFQNRFRGSVDFYRNFNAYEYGFGDLDDEFWLGLKYVQEMTSLTQECKSELRLVFNASDGGSAYDDFKDFYLGERPYYTLHLNPGDGSAGLQSFIGLTNSLYEQYGAAFSTFDKDQDQSEARNCAEEYHGAWWYNQSCAQQNLNGKYGVPWTAPQHLTRNFYRPFHGYVGLKASRMMFRRL